MWIPLHSDQLADKMSVSNGWYIWHPDFGIRCDPYDHEPYTNKDEAQRACNAREKNLRIALTGLHNALDHYWA